MANGNRPSNFLTDIVDADLAAGRVRRVVTRFPPEPNGFLHIGHAKSILLNSGLAKQYQGVFHLRFDDTNPTTEETEYVESIQHDVRWLGAEFGEHLYFASDYFERMYGCAVRLVKDGVAYVDTQSQDAIREQRGSFEKPGTASPYRDRSPGENLKLLEKMRAGGFPDGAAVLRAKIDMQSPNVLMRDPLLYRIRHAHHHRQADKWCIYPMYDYAHPLEDAIEGITHSICTLEFETNRELYDWVLEHTGPWDPRPHQYEFARLALGYTVMSKRKLLQLVQEKRVSGWDDPRMPTIAGMRRRGVTPEALRDFADLIGVAKNNSVVDIGKLEYAIRQDLEARSPRALAVLSPLKVTLTNRDAKQVDALDVPWWPAEPARGTRKVPLGREIYIERDDFSVDPPADWKRLAPGREVRLAGAGFITCDKVVKGKDGGVAELECSYGAEEKKSAGTLNWVDAQRSLPAAVRLYDRLFKVEQPDAEANFLDALNPDSLVVAKGARVEPALAQAKPGDRFQFLRQGYFFADPLESKPGAPVWNRTMGLKDTWAQKSAPGPKTERKPKEKKPEAPKKPLAERMPEESARFERYAKLGVEAADADTLAGDATLAAYFDAAVKAHPNAKSVARWAVNDLLGLAKDCDLASLKLPGEGFGRLVALVDAGRLTPAAGKALLADLLERGGDPEKRLAELGLEKVSDASAIDAAIARALSAQQAEVDRYRAGEKKLFGVLMGAVMKELQGAADAATVRKRLGERLR